MTDIVEIDPPIPDEGAVAEEATPAAPAAALKRLTPEQWAEIEAHYEYGTKSIKQIRAEYGISGSAISQHFDKCRKDGRPIIKNSKKHLLEAKTAAKVAETSAAATAAAVDDFGSKRRTYIEQSKKWVMAVSQRNGNLLLKVHKDIADGAATVESKANAFKSIKHSIDCVARQQDVLRTLLDMEHDVDEENLPKLIFEDLTEDEIKAIQENSDEDEVDLEPVDDDLGDDEIIEEGSS